MAAISAAIAVAGIGMSAYGAMSGVKASKDAAKAQQRQIEAERQAEALRRQAMEVAARRQSAEVVRNQQRARSLALSAASNQGAIGGSGLQGGYGQISGQSNNNLLGINQALDAGQDMFNINGEISSARIAGANAQSSMATAAGWSQLGGSLVNNAGTLGKIGQNFSSFGSAGANSMGTYGGFLKGIGSNGLY